MTMCITCYMILSFPASYDLWPVSSDVTCYVTVWSCHSNPNPSSKNRIKKINQKENKREKEIEKMLSPLSSFLILIANT